MKKLTLAEKVSYLGFPFTTQTWAVLMLMATRQKLYGGKRVPSFIDSEYVAFDCHMSIAEAGSAIWQLVEMGFLTATLEGTDENGTNQFSHQVHVSREVADRAWKYARTKVIHLYLHGLSVETISKLVGCSVESIQSVLEKENLTEVEGSRFFDLLLLFEKSNKELKELAETN